MKIFHRNELGEVERCFMFPGECPIDNLYDNPHDSHFHSGVPTYPGLSLKDSVRFAGTAKDRRMQMEAVAGGRSKAILALKENPNAAADALVSARTKTDLNYKWLVAIELHSNYPVWALTNSGLTLMRENDSFDENILDSDDIGNSQLLYIAMFMSPDWVLRMLSNPNNRITQSGIVSLLKSPYTGNSVATPNIEQIKAIIATGRFPYGEVFWSNHSNDFSANVKNLALIHSKDSDILDRLLGGQNFQRMTLEAIEQILKNKNLSVETRKMITDKLEAIQK